MQQWNDSIHIFWHDKFTQMIPVAPDRFGYFMDHAYFSAARSFREIVNSLGIDRVNEKHIGALTAILLHNSLFKFAISFYKDKETGGGRQGSVSGKASEDTGSCA